MTIPAQTATKDTQRGIWVLLSCVILWGVNAVAFKVCVRPALGVGFDPAFLIGLRFIVVGPCLWAGAWCFRRESLRLSASEVRSYIVLGFVAIVMGEILQPLALKYTTVANLTLLSHGTISLFTAVWALLLFGQRVARSGWVGAGIALCGVAIVASSSANGGLQFHRDTLLGDGIAVFRSLEHSCYLVFLGRWLQKHSVIQTTVYNALFGAFWLLPYVIYRSFHFDWPDVRPIVWWSLAYTIVPTTLYGFLAWNWAMRRVGPLVATNLFYLMPVSAALAAWVLLGEAVTWGKICGGLVIICGIVILRWDTLVEAGLVRGLPDVRLPRFGKR